MKKIFFAMVAILCCITVSQAQTSFVATLQHEGEFSHYYGQGALTEAYEAAVDGDIITLSPGTFTSPGTINKGIILRGNGVAAAEKTYISGKTTFVSTDETVVTTVEGIEFSSATYIQNNSTGSGQGTIKLIKSKFNFLGATVADSYSTDRGPVVRIYNCVIRDCMEFAGTSHPDFLFYNSYVEEPHVSSSEFKETTTAFINCLITCWGGRYSYRPQGANYTENRYGLAGAYYLNFYNCIFNWIWSDYTGTSKYYLLPSTATCYDCLSINKSTLFNNLVSGGNNKTVDKAADVFITYRSGHNADATYELTDAAKEAYLGTDGTQIGMLGGNYPHTTTVQYPIITKFNADAQTNKAGMLNVEVEVDGK